MAQDRKRSGGRGEGTPQKCRATPMVGSDSIWQINGVAIMLKLAIREKTACWKVHIELHDLNDEVLEARNMSFCSAKKHSACLSVIITNFGV